MTLRRFFSLAIGITKVHCIAMVSIRSVEQQHSNSHFFSIPFPFFCHFSLRSLPTIPFSECVFFWHFSLRSLRTLPFSEFPFFWQLKFLPAKPTVFRRLRRLQMPKGIRSKIQFQILCLCYDCCHSVYTAHVRTDGKISA